MSNTEPMALCLFQCGHLTGEIGNWSLERYRTNGSMFVSLWSSHWGKRETGPVSERYRTNGSMFVSLCSSHWGKRETGPVSDTGPMALCLFHCGNLA